MFKIDHDIPVPAQHHGKKYPLRELAVGASFFIAPEPGESRQKLQTRVCSAINMWLRHAVAPGLKRRQFTTRQVPGGVRVWRLDDRKPTTEEARDDVNEAGRDSPSLGSDEPGGQLRDRVRAVIQAHAKAQADERSRWP